MGFPDGSDGKEYACSAGDPSLSPGSGDPLEKGMDPLQYSCLENSMDRGAWQATVHGVTKSGTRQSTAAKVQFCLSRVLFPDLLYSSSL